MKTKFLVCEINNNKLLGATSYPSLEAAIDAFSAVVFDYGVETYEEMINSKIFESDDGYTVQIMEIIDAE